MKKLLYLLVFCTCNSYSSSVFMEGSFIDANKVYHLCTSNSGNDRDACAGYLAGAYDSFVYRGVDTRFCPPKNLSIENIINAYLSYAKQQGVDNLHTFSGSFQLDSSLRQAYPCKNRD